VAHFEAKFDLWIVLLKSRGRFMPTPSATVRVRFHFRARECNFLLKEGWILSGRIVGLHFHQSGTMSVNLRRDLEHHGYKTRRDESEVSECRAAEQTFLHTAPFLDDGTAQWSTARWRSCYQCTWACVYCCLLVCTIACLRSMVLALLPYFLMCGCHISWGAVNRFRFFLEFGK
jgi:hypothetical protein